MERIAEGFYAHHVAEHLWLVGMPEGMARFVSRDDQGFVVDKDNRFFETRAHACRAYREGYVPNVTYP